MTQTRAPFWTPIEDALLTYLRDSGLTGEEIYTAIPGRSSDAAQKRLQALRRQRVVR